MKLSALVTCLFTLLVENKVDKLWLQIRLVMILSESQSGHGLLQLLVVFIFRQATIKTFTRPVGKLNVRMLLQHQKLLQVIYHKAKYCQVFVKSHNFVFEKIKIEYNARTHQKWQKR